GEQQVAMQQLRQMATWADSPTCRRRALLAYFDEQFAGQSGPCCDVCRAETQETETVDCTVEAQKFLSCARRTGERFGVAHLIDVLRGSRGEKVLRFGHERLSTYGIGRDRSKDEWQRLAHELLRGGYLRQAADEFNAVKVTERGHAVLFKGERVHLAAPRVSVPQPAAVASEPDQALFDQLRALRKRLADERGVPPYVVFPDATLRQMAAELPHTREHLLRLQGVGAQRAEDYGEVFLEAIAEYVRQTGAQPTASAPPAPPQTRPRTRVPGLTVRTTLDLFHQGLQPAEIAAERQLALSTIEGHLAEAMEAGERLDLERLVSVEKRRAIGAVMAELGPGPLKPVMERLGEGYTYGELRLVRAALGWGGPLSSDSTPSTGAG
ncbi:MAG: helix-turn-helix domain-containing protein, partial [Chloroflexi bacterium]|nr:helix-turn-helix domain-containing protein [Chloroflexota bacterium]